MKIGVFVPQGWRMDLNSIKLEDQWNTILEAASNIENLGYESIWVYDHFHTVPKPTQDPTYECWTLMSALSQTTSKVRLGQMCTCNSYRNPAYLTKVASNIDVMSNGRLEYAIGAGWYDHEYRAYGYEYPSAGIRLKMLEESLIIYKKMTTEETPSFNGEFYQIDGAINQPKPIQKPYPPLWVCGGGEKVTLKLLAKYGDYGNWDVDVDGFIQKSNILQNHCENVGRDFNEIGKTLHTNVLIADNQNDLDRKVEKLSTYTNIPKDYYYERPLIGTKDKVFETIEQYKEAGCIYLISYIPDVVWGDTVNYLSELNQS